MRDPVHVVVVHHREPEACRRTVDRLHDQGVPVQVTVVDNGPGLDVSGAEVVALGTNTGFGPAANVGLRRWLDAGAGEWAVVVPHDALPTPGGLARLIAAAEAEHRVGLACADVGDGTRPLLDPYLGAIEAGPLGEAGWEPCDYPHGTLILLRRACLEQIGVFDERYFTYYEEADLGFRAKLAGWRVGLLRGERVENPRSSTPGPVVDFLRERNTILFLRTHFGRWPAAVRTVIGVAEILRGLLHPTRRSPWFHPRARLSGLWAAARGRYGSSLPPSIRASAGRNRTR